MFASPGAASLGGRTSWPPSSTTSQRAGTTTWWPTILGHT